MSIQHGHRQGDVAKHSMRDIPCVLIPHSPRESEAGMPIVRQSGRYEAAEQHDAAHDYGGEQSLPVLG